MKGSIGTYGGDEKAPGPEVHPDVVLASPQVAASKVNTIFFSISKNMMHKIYVFCALELNFSVKSRNLIVEEDKRLNVARTVRVESVLCGLGVVDGSRTGSVIRNDLMKFGSDAFGLLGLG